MTSPWLPTLTSVALVSCLSLVSILALWLQPEQLKKLLLPLVSLSVGGLLGDAFIHLIPDAFAASTKSLSVSLEILAGVLLFLILEKSLHFYHHHGHDEAEVHPFGYLSLFASGLHNFIDGLLIGVSYLVAPTVGLATTLAVVLHEIPHELGDFSILVHAGFKPSRALLYNFFSALFAVGGAVLALSFGGNPKTLIALILPITAGGFIYIAGSDLIPELNKERSLSSAIVQVVSMILGVTLMLAIKLFE